MDSMGQNIKFNMVLNRLGQPIWYLLICNLFVIFYLHLCNAKFWGI